MEKRVIREKSPGNHEVMKKEMLEIFLWNWYLTVSGFARITLPGLVLLKALYYTPFPFMSLLSRFSSMFSMR
jgi:hypothetical protein